MVSGNPYISVNSATMKAENAPNDRQSRGLFGLAKLNAKIMKISELMITSDHSPYADILCSILSCCIRNISPAIFARAWQRDSVSFCMTVIVTFSYYRDRGLHGRRA